MKWRNCLHTGPAQSGGGAADGAVAAGTQHYSSHGRRKTQGEELIWFENLVTVCELKSDLGRNMALREVKTEAEGVFAHQTACLQRLQTELAHVS